MDLIGRGAEAEVYKTSTSANILKIRKQKSYRLPILDQNLIATRTKSEAKIIKKL